MYDIQKIAKAIALIKKASGTNDKKSLLVKFAGLEGFKETLKFIYNPYVHTGISDKKLDKALNIMTKDEGVDIIPMENVIDYLTKHNTGSDADLMYCAKFIWSVIYNYNDVYVESLAQSLVTHNMKIGVTSTTLNAVYGKDFIPKTGCMLGTLYSDVPANKVQWPCVITEKLDGIRRVLIKDHGTVRLFSRSGHEDTGLVDIMEAAKALPDNTVYDGELLAIGQFKDNIAHRQATNSLSACKGEKHGLCLNVFDMIPLDDFYTGLCKITAIDRKARLAATFGDESLKHIRLNDWDKMIAAFYEPGIKSEFIKPVPILGLAYSIEEVEPIVSVLWEQHKEGVMLNTHDGVYAIKRSKELLKIKYTTEVTLKIVDMQEGTGRFEGMLGALIVDYKGTRVGVGSGFTDAERKYIWDNYSEYIGAEVEIETFGESVNALGQVSLNCPILKRFAGEVE